MKKEPDLGRKFSNVPVLTPLDSVTCLVLRPLKFKVLNSNF